ncbi:hypothetical protein [Sideroxydans lithotrophicus]|uniref:Uncharacterized protein n=1 Tax=Sideroxydans lithotrophicus (strain ES-1) TaxID=580332 RepID=D5CT35_SIDLE|nr:hypothetical protein [Sideroxydans lithotrophicus]ADE12121.1 hypothetical protein Slit_1892 [Sideroxydans lithotrophicus ES-1]
MLKKLLELITGDDNITLEPAYVWWCIAVIVGLGLEIYCTLTGKAFDLKAYGLGVGSLLIGGGVGKKLGT